MEFDLESIYVDVGKKIDALLAATHPLRDSDTVQEEAKDYLKILHSIINVKLLFTIFWSFFLSFFQIEFEILSQDEWSAEKHPDDEIILLYHAESLTRKLVKCITRAFDMPAEVNSGTATNNSLISNLGFDVPLLAITLSTLFSIVKRNEVVVTLTEKCVSECLYECLFRICDDRLLKPSPSVVENTEFMETTQQIVRALNMIILKLSAEANTSMVLHILLQIIFLCIPIWEVTHDKGPNYLLLLIISIAFDFT